MTRPVRVAIQTLGCKLNQYESDSVAATLRERGYEIVRPGSAADIQIVNTCTVTNRADRKSRNAINRARRTATHVVATGCLVENDTTGATAPSGSVEIVSNRFKASIPDVVDAYARGEIVDPDSLVPDVFGFAPPDRMRHTRTNVKIQDGCDNFCTYCIIPRVRGRAQSRPVSDILAEVDAITTNGGREIVLTGVNISRYRHETVAFEELVRAIISRTDDVRVRLSSLEPDTLDERFLSLFDEQQMMPHVHLCLQSGSDAVLRAMRRTYDTMEYRRVVQRLREIDPLFHITTDIIVAFPGESDADFEETLAFARELGFGHVHTFPYSVRSGTAAAHMKRAVPASVAVQRAEVVRDLATTMKRAYRSRLIGSVEHVLVESVKNGRARGLGEHYVPVDFAAGKPVRKNAVYPVQITSLEERGGDPVLVGVLE